METKTVEELINQLTEPSSLRDPRPLWNELERREDSAAVAAHKTLIAFFERTHENATNHRGETNYDGFTHLINLMRTFRHEPAVELLERMKTHFSGSTTYEQVKLANTCQKAIKQIIDGPEPPKQLFEVDQAAPWRQIRMMLQSVSDFLNDDEKLVAVLEWYKAMKQALPQNTSISDQERSNCWRYLGSIVSRLESRSPHEFMAPSGRSDEVKYCLQQAIEFQPAPEKRCFLEDELRRIS